MHTGPRSTRILGLVLRSVGGPAPALGGFGTLLRSAPRVLGGRSAARGAQLLQCLALATFAIDSFMHALTNVYFLFRSLRSLALFCK